MQSAVEHFVDNLPYKLVENETINEFDVKKKLREKSKQAHTYNVISKCIRLSNVFNCKCFFDIQCQQFPSQFGISFFYPWANAKIFMSSLNEFIRFSFLLLFKMKSSVVGIAIGSNAHSLFGRWFF